MNEMIERVARAIDPERWAAIDGMNVNDHTRSVLVAAEMLRAHVAIEAMREPTRAMEDGSSGCPAGDYCHREEVWKSMIDIALGRRPEIDD